LQSVFDETWRQKALRGDETAVNVLITHVLQPLYRFCLYRVGKNWHWCEEVVQETMLRALGDLAKYDPMRARNDIFP
jgi:DNA-directed RNA polymerase specialized sigma24 family protein